jgi:hypothetical protein
MPTQSAGQILDDDKRIEAEVKEDVSPLPTLIRKGTATPDELGS